VPPSAWDLESHFAVDFVGRRFLEDEAGLSEPCALFTLCRDNGLECKLSDVTVEGLVCEGFIEDDSAILACERPAVQLGGGGGLIKIQTKRHIMKITSPVIPV
jgi:hypothetical protein